MHHQHPKKKHSAQYADDDYEHCFMKPFCICRSGWWFTRGRSWRCDRKIYLYKSAIFDPRIWGVYVIIMHHDIASSSRSIRRPRRNFGKVQKGG